MSSEAKSAEPAWHRVIVALRNTRRLSKRIEHPCHVLHAMLIRGVRSDPRAPAPLWCWHPAEAESWLDKVENGRLYQVAVIFAGAEAAAQFAERLARTALENFALDSIQVPERRSFSALELEVNPPDWTVDELCLDFLTPLNWEAKPGPERWHLDARRLVRMLHHRLALFLGFPEWPEDSPLPVLQVRTEFAKIVAGHPHRSKSSPNTQQALSGLRGPVYLRGDWPALWQPLLLCSELQLGSNTAGGQGNYHLRFGRQFFDPQLASPVTWEWSLASFRRRQGLKGKEPGTSLPLEADLPALASAAATGAIKLAPAILFEVPKKDSATVQKLPEVGRGHGPVEMLPEEKAPVIPAEHPENRLIAALPDREQFIHFTLHRLLQRSLDRMFLPQSIGSRKERSREDARPLIDDALAAGCTHILEADVEDFFDHIDWSVLARQLREFFPRADTATLALVEACVRQPLRDLQGYALVRRGGVLQGSPLSSLLANLYLHEWDSGMRQRGWRFVRAVDDIRIFANSEAAAKEALRDATALLEPLQLRFNPAKTAFYDLRITHTFRFLGLTFGLDEQAGKVNGAPMRRALYLIRPETWAGVENGAVILRQGDKLDQRVPLHRVAELVLLGAGGISTELIDRCLRRSIPVSFCNQAGRHSGTLHPDARLAFARIARHHRRHEQFGLPGRAIQAARIVQAKLANYLAWLENRPTAESQSLRHALRRGWEAVGAEATRPDSAAAIDAIRGHEGVAARRLFPWVNGRAADRDWASAGRLPHERRDRWNLLIDTLSFLLFNRLHTACRSRGLDPWLGFLHSPENRYPSLIYDLMEPFRSRLDRFAVWLVNEGAIVPTLTTLDAEGRWGFTADGWRAIIRQFEEQLDFAYAADEGYSFRQLLERQVEDLVSWVDQGVELRLHSRPIPPWRKRKA